MPEQIPSQNVQHIPDRRNEARTRMDWIEQQDRARRLEDGTLSDHWEEEYEILRMIERIRRPARPKRGKIRDLIPKRS